MLTVSPYMAGRAGKCSKQRMAAKTGQSTAAVSRARAAARKQQKPGSKRAAASQKRKVDKVRVCQLSMFSITLAGPEQLSWSCVGTRLALSRSLAGPVSAACCLEVLVKSQMQVFQENAPHA